MLVTEVVAVNKIKKTFEGFFFDYIFDIVLSVLP